MDSLTPEALGPGLPPEAPMAMAAQNLRRRPEMAVSSRPSSPPGILWRRLFLFGATLLLTAAGAEEMWLVLNAGSISTLGLIMFGLFLILFAWIALSFVSSLAGFVLLLRRGERRLDLAEVGSAAPLTKRTALLMPTYNEEPARVFAGMAAIYDSVQATGQGAHLDFFILSDTTDPDIWIAEEAAFARLRAGLGPEARFFYRRRPKNIARKSGNIEEWVHRFGGAYEHLLILDADSLMTGEAIHRLAAAMERLPDAGLIQTLPISIGGDTLLARMQQFAGRIYGPMIAQGIAWWHGAEGNYWGHNAIIRTRAFAEAAGLPKLSGRKPFGGDILSHDFVEAALMRRAGWAILMAPLMPGSYEQGPPTLMDIAIRDRRWCQGNLQHAAVLPTRGLHFISRMHMMTGIGSYITAPLWMLFLLVGFAIALQYRFSVHNYFPSGPSLFPDWPMVDPVRAMWVFIGTMGLLLVPKMLATLAFLCRGADRRAAGGFLGVLFSMLLETLIAGLLAPITMLTQSSHVVSILAGKDAGWNPQSREDGKVPFGVVARLFWQQTVLGLFFLGSAYAISVPLLLWMLPVIVGLAFAIPLVWLTAQPGVGRGLRQMGLLLIPEERRVPAVAVDAKAGRASLTAPEDPEEAVAHLVADDRLLDLHRALLPPARQRGEGPIDVELVMGRAKADDVDTLPDALSLLSRKEKAALLADGEGVDRLVGLAGGTPVAMEPRRTGVSAGE